MESIARWKHALVAAIVIAAAFRAESRAATGLVLAAVVYVSWAAGRGTGLGFAIIAGALHFVGHGRHSSGAAITLAAGWAVVYVAVALAVSAIEGRTRPDHE